MSSPVDACASQAIARPAKRNNAAGATHEHRSSRLSPAFKKHRKHTYVLLLFLHQALGDSPSEAHPVDLSRSHNMLIFESRTLQFNGRQSKPRLLGKGSQFCQATADRSLYINTRTRDKEVSLSCRSERGRAITSTSPRSCQKGEERGRAKSATLATLTVTKT